MVLRNTYVVMQAMWGSMLVRELYAGPRLNCSFTVEADGKLWNTCLKEGGWALGFVRV